jgi:hypothetical protein
MAIDSGGVIHLVWTVDYDGDMKSGWGNTLYYSRYENDLWTDPLDVIVAPEGGVLDYPKMILGTDGYIHIFWRSHNSLQHSWVDPGKVDSAKNWVNDGLIFYLDPDTASLPSYVVKKDNIGNLHLVFVRVNENIWELVYTKSEDNGFSWIMPSIIAQASDGIAFTLPDMIVSDDGKIHIVWTEQVLPSGWPLTGVYYVSSIDQNDIWSQPLKIGESSQGYPSIIKDSSGVVHVVWNGSPPSAGRFHRFSFDGGNNWSPVNKTTNFFGLTNGKPVLAEDSDGYIHQIFFGDNELGTSIYSITWFGSSWGRPIIISDESSDGNAGHQAVTVQYGNRLHVLWMNQMEDDKRLPGIWYSWKQLSSSKVTPTPIDINVKNQKILEPTRMVLLAGSPTPSVNSSPESEIFSTKNVFSSSPNVPIIFSTLLIALLILVVLFKQMRR